MPGDNPFRRSQTDSVTFEFADAVQPVKRFEGLGNLSRIESYAIVAHAIGYFSLMHALADISSSAVRSLYPL